MKKATDAKNNTVETYNEELTNIEDLIQEAVDKGLLAINVDYYYDLATFSSLQIVREVLADAGYKYRLTKPKDGGSVGRLDIMWA